MSSTNSDQIHDDMFALIEQNEGERMAIVCRGLVSKRIAEGNPIEDWNLLIDEARMILAPDCAVESELQANLAFRSQISILDSDD